MKKYSPIKKPFSHRLFELSQSLSIIRDSIKLIKNGQIHQILPMSGQLRSLLIEKSKKNRSLLLVIAKELNEELSIYALREVDFGLTGVTVAFSMQGFPVSLEQELPGQDVSTIEVFLDRPIITIGSNSYTMKNIIEFYANKAGGSHYAPDMPQDFLDLLTFNIGGLPSIANALLQFGEVIYKLGLRLFRKLVDIEIHLLLLIPQKVEGNPAYVFDFKDPNSQMRLFCNIYPSIRPSFGACGLNGNFANVNIERVINWSNPHHLMFSIELEDDLSTSLLVYVDGERLAKNTSAGLVLVSNDPSSYDIYINRSAESIESGLNMAFADLIVYNVNHTALDRAKIILALNEKLSKNEVACTYLIKGAYAHLGIKQKEIKYFGSCMSWDMKKITRGEFPN